VVKKKIKKLNDIFKNGHLFLSICKYVDQLFTKKNGLFASYHNGVNRVFCEYFCDQPFFVPENKNNHVGQIGSNIYFLYNTFVHDFIPRRHIIICYYILKWIYSFMKLL